MATLRSYLTPAEQERFKRLYDQGYFDRITLERFTTRFGDEMRYIDSLEKRRKQAHADYAKITGSTAADVQRRSELQYTIDYATKEIPKRRAGAFDSVLSGDLLGRERRVRQNLEVASIMRPDGTVAPGGSPFGVPEADRTLMHQAWDKYWQEKGIVAGSLDIAASTLTGPIRGAQQLSTGGLGENPYEAIAEIGAFLPLLRAGGRLASASNRIGQLGGGVVRRVVDDPLWTVPSYSAQVSDIIGAEEGAWIEAVGEAGLEAVGAGGDLFRHLRGGRIFQGFDPQAAADAETADAAAEHDSLTGSRTAPGVIPDPAARAAADSAVESADAQTAAWNAQQQQQASSDLDLRRQAWERMLIEAEERDAAAAEQAAIEQSFIDQDDAYTAQQAQQAEAAETEAAAEAERIEHTQQWLPFYSDLAGGSQSEGIQTLNAEYEAGVRDPIRHRYDQIATGLQSQLGAIPSELHRETDRRLRQLVGEKWYNVYRGIDQRPTPQERAQRAEAAAEQIVEGGTDAESSTESTRPTSPVGDSDQQGTGEVSATTGLPGTEAGPTGDRVQAEEIPPAQIGTPTTAYRTDTTPYGVRPVVRELDDLVPSHDIEGTETPNYPQDLQPREGRESLTSAEVTRENARTLIPGLVLDFPHQFDKGPPLTSKKYPGRTVAGTGRTNMLKWVRDNHPEKWQEYQEALRAKVEELGIDPSVLEGMASPVLHYELTEDVDEVEIAKDTNIKTTLDTTGQEQAKHDADTLFDENVLALWNNPDLSPFMSAISDPENQGYRNALIRKIPANLRPAFLNQKNELSKQGVERIKDALMHYVFGGTRTAQLLIDAGGIEDAPKIKLMLDYILADLATVKSQGLDISSELDAAIHRLIAFSKQADAAPDAEKQAFDKTERMWKEVNSYLTQQEITGQDSPLERQILYLLYTRRGAEKQLAEHFQAWASQAVDSLSRQEAALFAVEDPVALSAALFDAIIKGHLTIEAFQVDKDRADLPNPWRTPGNLPPELRDIRREIDTIASPTEQTETFNAWVTNFQQYIRQGGETDATPEAQSATEETAPAAETGVGEGDGQSSVPDGDTRRTGAGSELESTGMDPADGTGADETLGRGSRGHAPADTHPSGVGGSEPAGGLLDDGLGPRFSEMSAEELLGYLQSEDLSFDSRSRDGQWNNYTIGEDYSEGGIGTGITVQLRTPENGTVRAQLFVIDRNNEVIKRLEKDIPSTSAKIATAREFIASLTADDIQAALTGETTPETPQQPSSGFGGISVTLDREDIARPVDTNQIVGTSRVPTETDTPDVSPVIQQALDVFGVTPEEWEQQKTNETAVAFLNNLPNETDAQNDAITALYADDTGDMDDDRDIDMDDEWDLDDDDDFFNDAETGDRLRDITDQQRSDFETVRRKLFLAKTLAVLERKTDKTPIETAQLSALKATQRTDAQQEIYEGLLTRFIDRQVARLEAKPQRSTTENRILETLTAVRAEGIPEEASDRSLYADLDTPDQEHSSPLAETRTLAGVQAPDTADTEVNLPESVTADKTKLSPAQLTSVKAIISAFKRKIHTTTDTTVQGGFLLADKPGVGKTRQALATIWHYMNQGIARHFVLAPNEQLLNNYVKDMGEMGGPADALSQYDSSNLKPTPPVGMATYNTSIRKPNLNAFNTASGNQNATADIVEHLIGVRPTLQQTHPGRHRNLVEAFERIGIHNLPGNTAREIVDNAVEVLRSQAQRINLDNPQAVDQFRSRLPTPLADLLLSGGTQLDAFTGSELHNTVADLLAFAQTHISAQPDPEFSQAAEDFQGVIILDEMHKAAGTNAQTGQMVEKLSELLPNAKFLYMSATPFKEIENFFIANRLGLWGANQAFPSFGHFARTFRRAVRGVKEVVPLHLKQIGRYVSRALSSKETRYTPVEVPLTDTEKAQYDTAVQLVRGIRQRLEASIDAALRTSWGRVLDDPAQGEYRFHYMKMFYGATQKFFLAVLDSMKAQGLQSQIQEQLQNGDKIIVQLENTWNKTVERARKRGQTTPGPFDLLIDFVENEQLFPVHAYTIEQRQSETGDTKVAITPQMEYRDGEQVRVVDPSLKQIQTEFLEALQNEMRDNEFAGGLAFAADIIHEIADAADVPSGEIAGRPQVYPANNPRPMPQDTESRIERTTAFSETTDLNIIVLGPAGLTGINLPVSEGIRDQIGNLYHYLIQSSWNVNTFEQGLGRGKRANSAIDPHYMIAHQDLPGADRVLGATLAKFAEMGAFAGQADSALMQNVDKAEGETSPEDDPEADVFEDTGEGEKGFIFGRHGEEALAHVWYDIYQSGDFEIADALGLRHPELAGDTGLIDPDTVPSVQRFFQRMLHQSTTDQPRYYQQFEARLKRIIAYKKELGQLDTGANDLDSKDGQIQDRLTIYTDPDTGQTAEMVKLSVKRKLPRRSYEFLKKVVGQTPGYEQHGGNRFAGIYTDAEGHVWAMFENPFTDAGETEYIRWGPRGTPIGGLHQGTNRVTETERTEDFTQIPTEGERQRLWEAEDADTETHVDSELFMATGMLLPKWDALKTGRYDHPVMGIIPMIDGSNLHGRVIPAAQVSDILKKVGGVDPNHFDPDKQTEIPLTPEGPDSDIPALVREIIGQQTDTRIQARLESIVEHIHKKLPLRLRGHRVRTAAEAALLGQLIRDPQVEHTWIVYRRDDRIVKIEPMSLNKKGETESGNFDHIKSEMARLRADSLLRIHNHPSGVAKWSPADKRVAMNWHRQLGTPMAEDIIVDSGTYAYRTFENGQYTWHEDIALDTDWNTSTAAVGDASGELRPDDPLYQNPLIRSAREAATEMWGLKYDTNVAELVFVNPKTGRITDSVTDKNIRGASDPASYLSGLLAQRPGQHVHVMTWGALELAEKLHGVEGVDSVWANETRYTGLEQIEPHEEGSMVYRDDRTAEEKETDAILNRAFERLTGEETDRLQDYTAQVQRTNPDSVVYRVHAPEDLSMEGRGRAKTAEIGEKALNTFVDSNAGIMKVLNAWTPTARRWARKTKNEFVSGFGRLTELEAPEGSDDPSPADVLKEILRERQFISKSNAGRAVSTLEPHLLAFNKLARQRVGLKTTAAAPNTRNAKRLEMSHQVWNFIEYNTPIENDPELLEVATEIKDAWRELLIYDTQKIVELMGELESINEKLYVTDAAGKREEWFGVGFDGFQWDAETRAYTQKGRAYTIEEAHRAADRLYMPHYFRGKSPLQQHAALQKMSDDLNTLLAKDTIDATELQRFEVTYDPDTATFTHGPTGKTASTPYEMVRIVADYLATEDAALQGILNYAEDEGRIGYYGHLERTRETDDRFYSRDIALMAENRIRLWDRLAEVAVLGQQHPSSAIALA